MNADKLAERIVKEVGGKNNIKEMFHCVTRLRFYLKDRSVVDEERIKKLDGVLGVQFATDQQSWLYHGRCHRREEKEDAHRRYL